MPAYQWKTGSCIKADAQKSGELFEQLAATEEGLTPETLLEANRPETAPLHNEYEWNTEKAAKYWQLHQSRHFIRSIVICMESSEEDANEEDAEPVRAFVITTEKSKYEPIQAVIESETKYEKLLEIALSELNAFKRKYDSLVELQPVIKAADTVIKRQYQSKGKRGAASAE